MKLKVEEFRSLRVEEKSLTQRTLRRGREKE
jgi:hypothetical protein